MIRLGRFGQRVARRTLHPPNAALSPRRKTFLTTHHHFVTSSIKNFVPQASTHSIPFFKLSGITALASAVTAATAAVAVGAAVERAGYHTYCDAAEDHSTPATTTANDASSPSSATTDAATTPTDNSTLHPRPPPTLISTSGGIWMWVLRAASEDWFLYLAAGAASIGMAICGVQTSNLFGQLFEHFKDPAAIDQAFANGTFWKPVKQLLVLFSVNFGLNFCATSFLARATNNLGQRLRRSYFAAVLKQDSAFFDQHKSGAMMQHLGEDIGAITTATRQTLTTGLRSFFDIVLGGLAMWNVSRELTLSLFGVLPVMAFSGHLLGSALRQLSRQVSQTSGIATAVANEDILNIKTVKAFVAEDVELLRYDDALFDAVVLKTTMSVATGSFFGMINLGISMVQLGICMYGGTLIRDGTMSSGGMISVVSQTMRLQRAFAGLSRTSSNLVKAMSTCDNVYEIAKRMPEEEGGKGGGGEGNQGLCCPLDVQGDIRFLNVRFAYPTRKDVNVLNSLYLEIQPGTVVALVGASGSGKSKCCVCVCVVVLRSALLFCIMYASVVSFFFVVVCFFSQVRLVRCWKNFTRPTTVP